MLRTSFCCKECQILGGGGGQRNGSTIYHSAFVRAKNVQPFPYMFKIVATLHFTSITQMIFHFRTGFHLEDFALSPPRSGFPMDSIFFGTFGLYGMSSSTFRFRRPAQSNPLNQRCFITPSVPSCIHPNLREGSFVSKALMIC